MACLFGLDNFLHSKTFSTRFEQEEDAAARKSIERIVDGVESEIEALGRGAFRLATTLRSKHLKASDPFDLLMQTTSLDVLMIYDAQGYFKYHRVQDPLNGRTLSLPELPNERLSEFHPLRRSLRSPGVGGLERVEQGLIVTSRGPVLIATRTAQVPGGQPLQVTVGRFLSGRWLQSFQGSKTPVRMHLLKGFAVTPEVERLVELIAESPSGLVVRREGETLESWGLLYDLGGNPACLLGQTQTSHLYSLWLDLREYSFMSMAALIVLCPLVLMVLLQYMVTGPLWKLTEHSKIIGRDSTTLKRLHMQRTDEIGQLASEFDSMLDQLAASRAEVIHTARSAGAADISTGILHNVGNSLNSVGVAARMATERLNEFPLEDLEMISEALQSNKKDLYSYLTQDPSGRVLSGYLDAMTQQMTRAVGYLTADLSGLLLSVEGVENQVSSLESTRGGNGLLERVDLSEQLDVVIELSQAFIGEGRQVRITRDYKSVEPVMLDRHKLSDVMLHLLRDSMQQAQAVGVLKLEISVGMRMEFDGSVCMTVSDDGMGLDEDALTRIFAMDSTHGGEGGPQGLHMASTAAIEMGADLTAHSPGIGLGATYQLYLPAESLAAQNQPTQLRPEGSF